MTDNPTADRARFVDAYNEILERERAKIGMVPEVRQFVDEIAEDRRIALETGEGVEIKRQFRLMAGRLER